VSEPKVTECWTTPMAMAQQYPSICNATAATFDEPYRPAVLIWKEDYDAMRKELDNLREYKKWHEAYKKTLGTLGVWGEFGNPRLTTEES
tara:strand:+ start:957 stop:1226 length:270 start_codon:yes stop_codon:yes gene_type:complete